MRGSDEKKGPRGKHLTDLELERAIEVPFNNTVFGENLNYIMKIQNSEYPNMRIPKVLEFLTNSVIELEGTSTEGIFRIPGDADTVDDLVFLIFNLEI